MNSQFSHYFEEPTLSVIVIVLGLIVLLFFINLIRLKNKKRIDARQKYIELKDGKEEQHGKALPPAIPKKPDWIDRLRVGLRRTRNEMVLALDQFLMSKKDVLKRNEAFEYLFELLIQIDVGVKTTEVLIERVKARLTRDDQIDGNSFKELLREEILNILSNTLENKKGTIETPKHDPHVVLVVGVNGVGKTTTVGKLAYKASERGQKAVVGAADTFRAAAVEQLAVWTQRANAELIRLKEGSDPASVAFETVRKAKELHAQLCFVDTAGRLQTRHDLMQELSKIGRVMAKDIPDAPHEVLLVLDATTGQNALQQALLFRDAVHVTGLILTKLDGTAKGGIVIAIAEELGLPIRYVGVGEAVEDLEIFQASEFVDALFA